MKKAFAVILIMIFSINTIVFSSSLSDVARKQSQIKEEINRVKKEKSNAQKEVDKIDNQIASVEYEINKIENQMNDLDDNIAKLQTELEQAEKDYAKQKEMLDTRVIALYKSGDTSYLEALLTATNISEFLSKYYLVGKIAENDRNLLSDIENSKNSMAIKKQDLENQLQAREEAKKNKEDKVKALSNNKSAKKELVSELTQEEKALQKEQDDLDAEYAKLKAEADKNSSSSSNSKYTGGTMQWPVPSSYRVTSPYGMRKHPVTGVFKMHTGIDIGASYGSNIVAANDGKVIQRGYSKGYGNHIAVDHGGGIVSFYAHASSLVVSNGQTVKKGQVIAKIGSTGLSTGNHLHFEVRKNGKTTDPLSGYLSK